MRKLFLLTVCLLFLQATNNLYAQWETQPEFPGGSEKMISFIDSVFCYPPEAVEKKIQGRVITNFVVEKDGSITNVQAVRGVHPLLNAEAVRMISSMPKWKPAERKGKIVRAWFTLPINFQLDENGKPMSYKQMLAKGKERAEKERIEKTREKYKQ